MINESAALSLSSVFSAKHFCDSVFEFIRETDQLLLSVEKNVLPLIQKPEDWKIRAQELSAKKIDSSGVSLALARLNTAMEDGAYQNSVLGIQRALNGTISGYTALRRLSAGFSSKEDSPEIPTELRHRLNRLSGQIFRSMRQITDALELAAERFFSVDLSNETGESPVTYQAALKSIEHFTAESDAVSILTEAWRSQLLDVLHSYGVEPEVNSENGFKAGSAGNGNGSHDKLSGNNLQRDIRIEQLEAELTRTVVAVQSRIDELSSMLKSYRTESKQTAEQLLDDKMPAQIYELRNEMLGRIKKSDKRSKKAKEDVLDLHMRLSHLEQSAEYSKPIPARVDHIEMKLDVLTNSVQKLITGFNQKWIELSLNQPQGQGSAHQQEKIDRLEASLKKLELRVEAESEKRAEQFKNVDENVNRAFELSRRLGEQHAKLASGLKKKIRKESARTAGKESERAVRDYLTKVIKGLNKIVKK